jgi:putative isomerase
MIKKSTLLLVVYLSIFGLTAFSQNSSIAVNYPQIIDLSYTPSTPTNSEKYSASLFSDAGSWIGFTNPTIENWVNGFCGPFTIDDRSWISKSIAEISVEKNGQKLNSEQFKRDSVSYFPGLLYMRSSFENTKIEQRLTFKDKNNAILQMNSDQVKWNIHSTIWLSNAIVKKENNSLVVQLVKGEILAVRFPENFNLTIEGNSYSAKSKKVSDREYILISFYNNRKEYDLAADNANAILKNPTIIISETKERWNEYLAKTLRNDMPNEYNRVAVKSVVTLMANWRAAKGDILRDGVIPSHSNRNFNGFWAWDSWKHATALAHFAPQLAKDQVRAMFDYQAEDGMVPDNVFSDKIRNNYRDTKPPLAAWAVMEIYKETKDLDFLKEMFPKLVKYNRWWYLNRDHDKNGICEYGSNNGLLKNAKFESGMDNAVRFDNAKMVQNGPASWSLNQESVDLNAFLYLENKLLKQMSLLVNKTYDDPFDAKKIDNYFFDEKNGYYYDRVLEDGFIAVEGTEAFIPLWSKMASPERAEEVIKMYQKPTKFSTYIPFPTVSADHPEFKYDKYWRGPVWIDQVYFAITGIRNYGYKEMADMYTNQVFTRLKGLTGSEPINENYDPNTGERLRAPNFSWSAAHLLLMYWEYGNNY